MNRKYLSPGTFLLLLAGLGLCACSPSANPPAAGADNGETVKAPPVTTTETRPNPELEKLAKNIQPEGTNPSSPEEKPEAGEKTPVNPPEKVSRPAPSPPLAPETAQPTEAAKPAGPPEGVNEKEILDSLKNTMILLGRAFESGSSEEVKEFMVVDADLKAILTGGGYSILGISLEAQNGQAVEQTLKAIKDKKIEHEFVPGQITYTPNYSIFKKQLPTMSKSKLLFKIDGTPVPFIFYIKQLVWIGKEWKVFNAEI